MARHHPIPMNYEFMYNDPLKPIKKSTSPMLQYNAHPKQYINMHTRSIMDSPFITLNTRDSFKVNKYQTTNLRTDKYTQNPKYYFPNNHKQYDLQGINDAQGAGMNIDLDSYMTRSNWVNKPKDNLVEEVKLIRYIDFLPLTVQPSEFCHDRFLVSTSISIDPQRRFEPEFDQYGVNTKHFQRYTDEYWRKQGNASNKYRKPAKYYRIAQYLSGRKNTDARLMMGKLPANRKNLYLYGNAEDLVVNTSKMT